MECLPNRECGENDFLAVLNTAQIQNRNCLQNSWMFRSYTCIQISPLGLCSGWQKMLIEQTISGITFNQSLRFLQSHRSWMHKHYWYFYSKEHVWRINLTEAGNRNLLLSQANSQEISTIHFLNIKFSATFYTCFDNPIRSLSYLLGTFAILWNETISFMSVAPHRKNLTPLNKWLWNLYWDFLKYA